MLAGLFLYNVDNNGGQMNGIVRRRYGNSLAVAAILLLAAIGRVFWYVYDSGDDPYFNLVGEQLMVRGVVADDPGNSRRGLAVVLTDVMVWRNDNWLAMPGKVWLTLDQNATVQRYDQIVVSGVVDSGFGAYRAIINQATLESNDHSSQGDLFGWWRTKFRDSLERSLTKDQTGLAMGLLAGDKSGVSYAMLNLFSVSALTHIIVASGYNLTILSRLVRRLLAKRSRLLALLGSLALMLCFVGIAGWSASMERALLVSVVSLFVWYVGRQIHPLMIIILSSAVTVIINPSVIFGDLGWYLSFLSFAGVLLLAPLLGDIGRRAASRLRRPRSQWGVWLSGRIVSLGQIVCETASAQILTLPIIALSFGVISTAGLITNLLVLPIIPLLMLLVFILGISGFILPSTILAIVAWPVQQLLNYVIWIVQVVAGWNFASLNVQITPLVTGAVYLAIVLIIMVLVKMTNHNYRGDNVIK